MTIIHKEIFHVKSMRYKNSLINTQCPNHTSSQVEAPIFASLINSFDYMEISNRKILNYGWVNFPLAYVQVATLSVYLYLAASLFGCQFLGSNTVLQF